MRPRCESRLVPSGMRPPALRGEERAAEGSSCPSDRTRTGGTRGCRAESRVAGPKPRHTGPDLLDHAASLVTEHGREEARRVAPAHGVGVRVADAGRDQADQALAGPRALEVDLVDHERLARLPADGGADLHDEARG